MSNTIKHNIMVIEDSPTMQQLLKIHLKHYGLDLNVFVFSHIRPATEFIENTTNHIDLIICDVMLPGEFTGVDFLRFIRKDQRFHEIPFVIITANTDTTIQTKSIDLNCNGFLYKPFTMPQIHDVLKQWLKIES